MRRCRSVAGVGIYRPCPGREAINEEAAAGFIPCSGHVCWVRDGVLFTLIFDFGACWSLFAPWGELRCWFQLSGLPKGVSGIGRAVLARALENKSLACELRLEIHF